MSNSKYNPQSHRLGGRRFSQSQSQPGEPIKLRAHLTGLIFFFFFLPHFVPIFFSYLYLLLGFMLHTVIQFNVSHKWVQCWTIG